MNLSSVDSKVIGYLAEDPPKKANIDTIIGGNRERCLRTGFTTPPKLTPKSLVSFATHPGWTLRYLLGEKFEPSSLNWLRRFAMTSPTPIALTRTSY